MNKRVKSWVLTGVKVAIAVVGLWIVVWPPWKPEPVMTWDDRITLKAGQTVNAVTFLDPINVKVLDWAVARVGNQAVEFPGRVLHLKVDGREMKARLTDGQVGWERPLVKELPAEYFDSVDEKAVPLVPKLQIGIKHLIVQSNKKLLLLAWAVLVIPFLVTAWRWRKLMEPQGIALPYQKCLALTFVGQFYSTFLPGITGGDLVKIVYTSRVTGSKMKSTVTILLDRVIGLTALLVIATTAAGIGMTQGNGGGGMMKWVFLGGLAALAALAIGCGLYFSRTVRRMIGLGKPDSRATHLVEEVVEDAAIGFAPPGAKAAGFAAQVAKVVNKVKQVDETLHAYRHHWRAVALAFGAALLSQLMLPISAWLAGMALGIPETGLGAYMSYVPIALLMASVPISPPQGFGVTEYILLTFFHTYGKANPGQTFALAQAVRFLPVMWNLVGAYWVVRGDYSRHGAMEGGVGIEG